MRFRLVWVFIASGPRPCKTTRLQQGSSAVSEVSSLDLVSLTASITESYVGNNTIGTA